VAKWLVGLVALVGILTLAACGSGGGHPAAKGVTATPTTAETPSTRAEVSKHAKKAAAHKAAAKKSTAKKSSTPQVTVEGISVVPTTAGGFVVVATVPAGGHAPVTIPPATVATLPHRSGPTTTVKPYDPGDGIDLSGTPGVTPAQQQAAEQLIRDTIKDIAKYKDQSVAYADGFRTIGDGFTGDEHWVNWSYGDDGHILDPQYPESLVYNTRGATPQLEAAMYSLPPGSRFSDIPPLFQSPLTQFHVHNNLCFAHTQDPKQLVVAGFTNAQGNCPAGLIQEGNEPMIHVWITPNACGPFAALSGVAAGQVPPGEQPNCDTAHAGVL
jgi:hypothetical protein